MSPLLFTRGQWREHGYFLTTLAEVIRPIFAHILLVKICPAATSDRRVAGNYSFWLDSHLCDNSTPWQGEHTFLVGSHAFLLRQGDTIQAVLLMCLTCLLAVWLGQIQGRSLC